MGRVYRAVDIGRVDNRPVMPGAADYRLVVLPWTRLLGHRLLMTHWLAITIGRWILAWRPLDDTELAHELEHVRQWQRYGLLFIPRYLRASWRSARAGGDRYRDNLFERAARAAARSAAARVRE